VRHLWHAHCYVLRRTGSSNPISGERNGDYEEVSDQQQKLKEDHHEEGRSKERDLLCKARDGYADDPEDLNEGWPGLLLTSLVGRSLWASITRS
jgi:hypothetical protein